MTINYAPTDPVAGASRATAPTEVTRWTDYADTIADVDTRITTVENATSTALWVPAAQLISTAGASALHAGGGSGFNRTGVLLFDAAGYESASAVTKLPPDWATVNMDLVWLNAGAGAGNVVWTCRLDGFSDGDDTQSDTSRAEVTATAPAQYIVKVTRLLTSVAASGDELFHRINVFRRGGEAGDTLANDAGVVGVVLGKA